MAKKMWGSCAAHWGDVLCSLALFRDQIGEGNIAYYGSMPEIVEFLHAQPYIHQVKWILGEDKSFNHWWSQETLGLNPQSIVIDPTHNWQDVFVENGIPSKSLIRTHLHKEWIDGPISFLDSVSLPMEATEWADRFRQTLPEDFLVLNPFSFASTSYSMHWPLWGVFMREMCSFTPKPLKWVLVGHQWHTKAIHDHPGENDNIVDMVDQIPKMMYVLALANMARGIMTTSNSLAHWGAVNSLPTSVMCNMRSSVPEYYFRRILNHPALECWNHDAILLDGLEAASRIFPYP